MEDFNRQILATLIYYDIFDYPLTSFEVWKYLDVNNQLKKKATDEKIKLGEVVKSLESEDVKKRIEEYRGFYFLRGRKELVEKRLEKNKLSEQKFKIIRGVVFWLQFLPYVRLVAVTGTVAMKNAAAKSDLDLLIVFKHGRIFLGRTLLTGLVQFMGKRRYKNKIADRICLNCFLTDESLESRLQDPFSASEYFFTVPLIGWETFLEFQNKNSWINRFKTNFHADTARNSKMLSNRVSVRWIRSSLETILNLTVFTMIEKRLEKWQTERIANDPRTWEEGSIIIANTEALIFFHQAHSLTVAKLFQRRLGEMDIH